MWLRQKIAVELTIYGNWTTTENLSLSEMTVTMMTTEWLMLSENFDDYDRNLKMKERTVTERTVIERTVNKKE